MSKRDVPGERKTNEICRKGKDGGRMGVRKGRRPCPAGFLPGGEGAATPGGRKFFRRRYFGKYSGRKALSTGAIRQGRPVPRRVCAGGGGACFREEERGTPRAGGSAERCPFRRLCGESAAPGQGRKKTSEERNSPDVLSERTERPSEGHVFLRKSVSLPPFRGGAEKTRLLRISPRACVPRGCPRRPPRRPRRC